MVGALVPVGSGGGVGEAVGGRVAGGAAVGDGVFWPRSTDIPQPSEAAMHTMINKKINHPRFIKTPPQVNQL
jgi:hypothetical protein